MKKKGQNLVEFVFIMPLVMFLLFMVFDLGLYWKNVHTVQSIASEAASKAASGIVTDNQTGTDITDLCDNENFNTGNCVNYSVALAYQTLLNRYPSLSLGAADFSLSIPDTDAYGDPPYTLYKFESSKEIDSKPFVTFIVDCRDPYSEGIVTQLIYQYTPMFTKFAIVIPGLDQDSDGESDAITILPDVYEISSTQVKEYSYY